METATPLRVLIVDDHADVRLFARMMLEAEERFEVAGEAVDGLDAVERTVEERPEVVLLDADMPGLSDVDTIPFLLRVHPEVQIIVFTAHPGQREVALRRDAAGFLEKGRAATDLPDALATTLAEASGADHASDAR